ncbi:MAG: PAS domain S-box protein [Blastocatellia bacterium]|nr:PAS domain S-box protein [Blastocatellia bacterium]
MSETPTQPSVADLLELVENVTDLIQNVRPDGSLLYVNRAWCRTLGYSREEAARLSGADVIHPRSRNYWQETFNRALSGEQVAHLKATLVTKDGREVPVEASLNCRFQDGQPAVIRSIFRDLTKYNRAEPKADHSYALLKVIQAAQTRFLMEEESQAVLVTCEDRVVFVNQAAVRLLGASSQEALLGRNPLDIICPDSHSAVWEGVQGLLDGQFQPRVEGKCMRLDGSVFDIQAVKAPIVFEGQLALQVILTDVSESKRAEEQLRFQTLILNHIHDAVIATDLEGIITGWYPGAERMFGYTSKEIVGQPIAVVYPEEEREVLLQEVIETLKAKGHHDLKVRLVRKSGERFVAYLSLSLIPDSFGQVTGMVGYSLDITSLERAEQTLRESEARLAADLDAMNWLQKVSTLFIRTEGFHAVLEEVVAAAIAITKADMGNIQLFDAPAGTLRIAAQRGFDQPFLDFFKIVPAGEGAYGMALQQEERLIIEDVTRSPIFSGKPALDVILQAGVRAVQSTVLRSRSGRLLGLFSTYYKTPRQPDDWALRLLDILARQAADIIEREEAERALRASEERYRSVVQDQTEFICRFAPDCRIVWVNDAYARFFGKAPQDLAGRSFLQFIPEAEWASVQEFFASFTLTNPVRTHEHQVIDHQGQPRWQQWTNRALFDDCGHLLEFQGVARDITERKQAEEALRDRELRYRTLVDATSAVTWSCPSSGLHIKSQPAWMAFTGQTAEEMLGAGWTKAVHPNDLVAAATSWTAAVTKGEPFSHEHRIRRHDGEWRWMYVHAVPFRDANGQILEWIGMNLDITERKLAEEKHRQLEAQIQYAQKLESLGVLAGGIAHDFNNLLTSILGYSDLAKSKLTPGSPPWKFLDEVVNGTRRAAELTKQMLAYAGKGRLVLQPLNLSELVGDMGRLLEISISKKCVLQYHCPTNLPACEADPAQMRQVVMSLILNASEAIGDNPGVIALSTGVMHCDRAYLSQGSYLDDHLPEGSYVYVEVSDTGCGMTEQTKAKIFDPFFTTKFTGRGLGLAAVFGIVRSHRGTITVSSELGKGTTFRVLFPAASPADAEPAPTEPAAVRNGKGLVLVIDDEELVRGLTGEMMEVMGFRVLTAAGGREGVEVFRREQTQIRLVLLDMIMPQVDGEETFHEMQRIRTGVPTVIFSGYNKQTVMHSFAGKDRVAFIQKPFDFQQLLLVVQNLLGESTEPNLR